MLLAIELVPNLSTPFAPHHKYEMYVKKGDTILEKTRGADTFSFNGTLLFGEPLTATGRTICHKPSPDLADMHGTPARPAEIEGQTDFSDLTLWLDTNAILAQELLQPYYALRVSADETKLTVPLLLLKIHWEGQGLFKIYLDGLNLRKL